MLVALNCIVLTALLILLILEETRCRRFFKSVEQTKQGLLALAHELRSPLAQLRKYHEFLRSDEFGKLSFAQQEALSRIDTAFSETVVLVERLLARSRIDDGRIAPDNASVDLIEIVSAAIRAVEPQAQNHEHRLAYSGPKSGAYVRIDPLLLHGILDELLMNAILYMPRSGVIRITVKTDASSVRCSIQDQGIGIPAAEKKFVFQKFFRGEKSRLLAAGNGLGLAFAKQFTQQANGKIEFVSKDGKGSTFTVILPRKKR